MYYNLLMQEKITKNLLKIDYESYTTLLDNFHFTIGDEI